MSFARPQSSNVYGGGRRLEASSSPTASRRAASASRGRKVGSGPAAANDVAANLLAPKPGQDIPNRVLVHSRRPNTAGLQQHTRPWSFDTLQTIVTRNGIGCATWRCTMRELSVFQRTQRRRGGGDDDASDGEEEDTQLDAQLRKEHSAASLQAPLAAAGGNPGAVGAGVAGEPPAVSRLAAAGRFPITEVPRDAVLLKLLRSLSALEDAMERACCVDGTSNSVQVGADAAKSRRAKANAMDRVSRDLRSVVVERPEIHRSDTRAPGVSVKVVHRHTMIDVCKQNGSWDRSAVNALVDCFQAFSGGESVVMVQALDLALDHIQQQSALSLLHVLFHGLKSLKASAHRAELYAVERAVASAANDAQRFEAKSMEDQQQSAAATSSTSPYRRKSFSLPVSSSRRLKGLSSVIGLEASAEFNELVANSLHPRRRGTSGDGSDAPPSGSSSPTAAAAAMVAVDAVTWKELRNSIINGVIQDGVTPKYPRLSALVLQHNL